MNTQYTVTQEPGLVIKCDCDAGYTSPAEGDQVELTDSGVVAPIADATTSNKHLGEVVALSPTGQNTVSVETPFTKFVPVQSAAAIATPGLGIWEGQKVRLWAEGSDAVALLVAAHGMMILSTAAGADETVYIAY